MKCKGIISHDPFLVVCYLEHIGARPAASENEVWRKEGIEEAKSPSVIGPKVFSVCKIVTSYDSLFGGEHLVWCAKRLDDRGKVCLADYDETHILRRNGLIERHSLPSHRTSQASGQRHEHKGQDQIVPHVLHHQSAVRREELIKRPELKLERRFLLLRHNVLYDAHAVEDDEYVIALDVGSRKKSTKPDFTS